jgi:vitamin B12/bleomycin/antimicrobial peptide transport system ATP-binding/permease protein
MKNFILAFRTFIGIAVPYFRSERRWQARGLFAGMIGAELSVVYLAVLVNQWHARFFNAVEARNWDGVQAELFVFIFLTGGAIVTAMLQYYFGVMFLIRWREWLTERYVALWMTKGRHYKIRFVDPSVDNIHLRIGGDLFTFLQKTIELGTNLLNSLVTFGSFSYILWGISANAPLPLFGYDFSFPGYLIVAAIGFASMGMVFAHFIGYPLIPLNFRQQRLEADFRFAMARVSDNTEPVALMGGEAVERAELDGRFGALVRNWITLILRQNRLNAFIFGYYHVSTVLPTLIVTPAYLVGAIPLGVLMQSAFAFDKVEKAFAYCTQYAKIAEWKALMDRVAQFEAAMGQIDEATESGAALDVAHGLSPDLSVKNLVLRLADGEAVAAVPDVKLAPAQRLLVSGASGTGKSSLLRALAGIWPLGEGSIRLPQNARLLALPQRPYFPLGTLRQGLTYPMLAEAVDDAEVRSAMTASGLGHLVDRLDTQAEWSTALSGGEQQRAGIARALILRPTVLLLDEAVSTLEDAEAHELFRVLAERLPGTIMITVGGEAALTGQPHRNLDLAGLPLTVRAGAPLALAPVPA